MPALYLSHGAPPLVDDQLWTAHLRTWPPGCRDPRQILIVSAHWEAAPLMLGATETVPLVYDFGGFAQRYYRGDATRPRGAGPRGAGAGAAAGDESVARTDRGLDHGAYVPLTVMYPDADIPVLQMSLPTLDPERLLELGRRLRPLRDEGVLIVGPGSPPTGCRS
jgi:4,5-DOPA dioxygenase extradiol